MRRNSYQVARVDAARTAQRLSLTPPQRIATTPQGRGGTVSVGDPNSLTGMPWFLGIGALSVTTRLG